MLILMAHPKMTEDITVVDRGPDTVVILRGGLPVMTRKRLCREHLTAAEYQYLFPEDTDGLAQTAPERPDTSRVPRPAGPTAVPNIPTQPEARSNNMVA